MNDPSSTPKAILVTGAAGFLGGGLCAGYKRLGWRVAGLDVIAPAQGAPARAVADTWMTGAAGMEAVAMLHESAGPFDAIFHAAGPGMVGPSFSAPLADFEATVGVCAQILEFIRTQSPSTVFAFPSSAAVYGAVGPEWITEDSPKNPVSPYGYHKLMAEELCRSYSANFGLKTVAVRFFSIYGPKLRKQLLWDLAQKSRAHPSAVQLSGTGEETRDLIYVDDAVRLVQIAVEKAAAGRFTAVNGASGAPATIASIAKGLLGALGYQGAIKFDGVVRKGDPAHYRADIGRARAMGFSTEWALPAGLASYAAWVKGELDATPPLDTQSK